MRLFRLARKKYALPLSGYGASLASNNRWNSKGTEIIYTAENRSLAILEVLVHLSQYQIPDDYVIVSIDIPETKIEQVKFKNRISRVESQTIGDQFILRNKDLLLKVPSVLVPGEFNFLINPNHSAFNQIKVIEIKAFNFDQRLFDK